MTDATDAQHEPTVDTVTRQQEGQFIDEGGSMFTPNLEEEALAGGGEAQLIHKDSQSVHALQVNMERSGADYVQAQKSFLTNSGAREIHSDSSKLTNSGVLTLNADSVDMKQSSSIVTNAKEVSLNQSRIGVGIADKVQMNDSSSAGVLVSGDVDAQGDVRSFLLIGGNVKAGGNVVTTMDAPTVGVAVAVFAIVLVVFRKLLGGRG